MSSADRNKWEDAHRAKPPGDAEPFVVEALPMLERGGLVLDVAAGRGRNSIALAKASMRVIAADYSPTAMRILAECAREQNLPIWPVIADFDKFAFRENSLDAIVNVNFLDRALFPHFAHALKTGGLLLVETFLIDQAEIGHPKNLEFLLKHHELRDLMSGLELLRYREGLISYPDGSRAWRASAIARRIN